MEFAYVLWLVAEQIPAVEAFLNTRTEAGTEIEQAAAIRTWLPANRALLNRITALHLGFSGLTILPDEITLFTQATKAISPLQPIANAPYFAWQSDSATSANSL